MAKSSKRAIRILFVGNSFTARNDLPKFISQLAGERGISLEPTLLSMGGASLRMHWNKGEALNAIEHGGYDYVVLQEQSTLPVKNAARMRENVLLFDEVIGAVGARTVLYMTWARKHSPEQQQAITEAYESIGREIGAVVVPVGKIWWKFMATDDSPVLHDKDQSHPTLAGSYLAGCAFLVSLFGESPLEIEYVPKGLKAADAQTLQKAVASHVS
jgi:hypothetical protein